MLGGKPPIPEITERVGYDLVLLGGETLDGMLFTVARSSEGGGPRLMRVCLRGRQIRKL